MLLFSKGFEYAFRAALCIAGHDAEPMVMCQVADRTRVPCRALSKVFQRWGRCGFVPAQRGLHVGCLRVCSSKTATILDVRNAIEPVPWIGTCPSGLTSHGTNLGRLCSRWDAMLAIVERALEAITLAALMSHRVAVHPCAKSGVSMTKMNARSMSRSTAPTVSFGT